MICYNGGIKHKTIKMTFDNEQKKKLLDGIKNEGMRRLVLAASLSKKNDAKECFDMVIKHDHIKFDKDTNIDTLFNALYTETRNRTEKFIQESSIVLYYTPDLSHAGQYCGGNPGGIYYYNLPEDTILLLNKISTQQFSANTGKNKDNVRNIESLNILARDKVIPYIKNFEKNVVKLFAIRLIEAKQADIKARNNNNEFLSKQICFQGAREYVDMLSNMIDDQTTSYDLVKKLWSEINLTQSEFPVASGDKEYIYDDYFDQSSRVRQPTVNTLQKPKTTTQIPNHEQSDDYESASGYLDQNGIFHMKQTTKKTLHSSAHAQRSDADVQDDLDGLQNAKTTKTTLQLLDTIEQRWWSVEFLKYLCKQIIEYCSRLWSYCVGGSQSSNNQERNYIQQDNELYTTR